MNIRKKIAGVIALMMAFGLLPCCRFAVYAAEITANSDEVVISDDSSDILYDDMIAEEAVNTIDIEDDYLETYVAEQEADTNGNIASGTNGNVTWVIDSDGKLTVRGTGDYESGFISPWYTYNKQITEAVVDLTGVTKLGSMFTGCSNLKVVDLSRLNTSNVTNMAAMFNGCSSLTKLDVTGFDTSNVKYMNNMFNGCNSLTKLDVSGFNTSKVISMRGMFSGCSNLTSLDVSGFDTSNVTEMGNYYSSSGGGMFEGCKQLKSLDVSGFNTSKVTDMGNMFNACTGLTSLDVSNFDTSNVTCMYAMFESCTNLTGLDVSGFDTSKVTNMNEMFSFCNELEQLDLSNMEIRDINETETDCFCFIRDCKKLLYIKTPRLFNSNIVLPGLGGWLNTSTGESITSGYLPTDIEAGTVLVRNNSNNAYGSFYTISVKKAGDGTVYINDKELSSSEISLRVNSGNSFDIRFEPANNSLSGILTIDGARLSGLPDNKYSLKNILSDHSIFIEFSERVTKGDVTGDGIVAMGDVVKVARAVAGNVILTEDEKKAADVTGDNVIAMGDVVKLARFVAGSVKEL